MRLLLSGLILPSLVLALSCSLSPLGLGKDDTDQVLAAIDRCGTGGSTTFSPGDYNITRKMMWNLTDADIDLQGYLNFAPTIPYWLQTNSTYRVVQIQSQSSWFVLTGTRFSLRAHNAGGIRGNGQPWWDYYTTVPRLDGDGRPIALTVWRAEEALIEGFRIESPPFWSNAVVESRNVVYDGMYVNATNTNPTFFGQNIVPNTDGIDTYRVDNVALLNWDVTCGDDCLAIKGNTTNLLVKNVTCRGGNGIAFGSLGQYANLPDQVSNVLMEDLTVTRINASIQPNMGAGVYLKTWTGEAVGVPPDAGGGGTGYVKNVTARSVSLNLVDTAVHLYQTNGGNSSETPSTLQFSDLSFDQWSGTTDTALVVDIECSPAVPCPGISFSAFNVEVSTNKSAEYKCIDVAGTVEGLPGPCNATG